MSSKNGHGRGHVSGSQRTGIVSMDGMSIHAIIWIENVITWLKFTSDSSRRPNSRFSGPC